MNKVKNVNFHPINIEDKGVSFSESYCTILCKKYYYSDINKEEVLITDKERYYKDNNFHRVYYGEIINIFE